MVEFCLEDKIFFFRKAKKMVIILSFNTVFVAG